MVLLPHRQIDDRRIDDSCVCERFIYSYSYPAAGKFLWTYPGIIYKSLTDT